MPDISMCQYKECSKAKSCYRFMAFPNSWQSYSEFQNICNEKNNYQWFYEIDGKPVRKDEAVEGN